MKAFFYVTCKDFEVVKDSMPSFFVAWCNKARVNRELEHYEWCIMEEYKANVDIRIKYCYSRSFDSEKQMDWRGQRNTKLAVNFLYRYC